MSVDRACDEGPLLEEQETEGQRQLHNLLLQQLHTDVDIHRVSRQACDEGPLLEEQETEGQRQLHNLLLQQLHTDVDIHRCVAKRKCFAPAALYRPFGQQAAGVRTLSQFQVLQDGDQELESLRDLGLTDAEIQLWQSRDDPENTDKAHGGVCVAPGAKQQRLQVIRDKMSARAELLRRPQRFSASRPLSRREMEIERSLFQGNERLGFLAALYHRDEDNQENQQGASSSSSSDPMDSLYRDVLGDRQGETTAPSNQSQSSQRDADQLQGSQKDMDQSQGSQKDMDQSQGSQKDMDQSQGSQKDAGRSEEPSEHHLELLREQHSPDAPGQRLAAAKRINISQPISSLRGAVRAGSGGPLTITGEIENIPDEEILKNRESEEGIRSIPRFCNYRPGEPSKVLCVKNLSAQASAGQLVALFSRFQPDGGPPVLYRLLTGRMKGQAFITLADAETAQKALQLVHGYRLLGKPLVVEFGHKRREEEEEEKKKQRK
ncbi:RNA-binding protein 41 [Diretmus argenteus]